jgi:carbonic anhydrase
MSQFDELLAANAAHVEGYAVAGDGPPRRRLAVFTCMDARIDPLAVLGLELGDAHVLRNAGARVTDDVLRSLILSTHLLGVESLVVMQHTRCGVAGTTDDELRAKTGATREFLAIHDHAEALRADVDLVAATMSLAPLREIVGLVYDVDTGRVTEHARWERSSPRDP